jgi:hypothetical protein
VWAPVPGAGLLPAAGVVAENELAAGMPGTRIFLQTNPKPMHEFLMLLLFLLTLIGLHKSGISRKQAS